MFYRILLMLGGAARVTAKGVFAERFINLAAREGIRMWDIERSEDELRFTLPARSFRALRGPARASGVRIRVVGRMGLPFVVEKYRMRRALWLGSALFLFALYSASLFLWDIRVTGCKTVDPASVEQTLAELGVRRGSYIPSIDVVRTQQLAMLEIEQLSFIAVNIKGVTANVEVRERVIPPTPMTPEGVRSLAASRDGLIERMEVYRGTAVAQRGGVVQRGDLLVSGEIPSETGEPRYVAAEARVIARTWRNGVIKADREAKARVYTGRSRAKYELLTPFCNIKLSFNSGIEWPEYDKITKEYRPRVFGVELPVGLAVHMYGEVTVLRRIQSDEELEQLCLDKLSETLAALPDGVAVEAVQRRLEVTDDEARLQFEIEAVEDIAEPIPLY